MDASRRNPSRFLARPDTRSGLREGRQGFTLLEVMLTVALLTGVSLSTSLLLVPVARQTRIGRETEIANSAARRILEQIQATPFKDIIKDYPPATELSIPDLTNGKITISYQDPTADPLFIRADLSWQSPDLGTMARTFHTVRTE
jgi:prepilin-type N-terminal cleavage/methylation domain-containing protein